MLDEWESSDIKKSKRFFDVSYSYTKQRNTDNPPFESVI